MIEREPPLSCVEYVVEDNRENSGYLQIQNPAPCAGFFEPSVPLGSRIAAGQRLGCITADVLGVEVLPVLASQSGLVLGLRVAPYVEKGESVGVVLEVDALERGRT
jgi:predicted deacylase